MDTNRLLAHVAGLNEINKPAFRKTWNSVPLSKHVRLIDLDELTSNIVNDQNMGLLYAKYDETVAQAPSAKLQRKSVLAKARDLEKKMWHYWKSKIEHFIGKELGSGKQPAVLIGSSTFFKNQRTSIDIDTPYTFLAKESHEQMGQAIIRHNLDHYRDDIIAGTFDLSYLDADFLTRKRMQTEMTYTKKGYVTMPIPQIINSIELITQINYPRALYVSSEERHEKKLPAHSFAYIEEWLALVSAFPAIKVVKGRRGKRPFAELPKTLKAALTKPVYLYECLDVDDFIPYPTKDHIYKFVAGRPVRFHRMALIEQPLAKLQQLGVDVKFV